LVDTLEGRNIPRQDRAAVTAGEAVGASRDWGHGAGEISRGKRAAGLARRPGGGVVKVWTPSLAPCRVVKKYENSKKNSNTVIVQKRTSYSMKSHKMCN
jgi:hypothetical protein